MICIYEKTETSFTYNGLGTLEPTYCSYSPYINDVWKLEMYLPYDPEGKYKLVANGRILKVTGIDCIQEQTSDYQLFSIETYRKEGNSIYVLAYPVGMDARFDTYANQVNANYKTASEAIALINGVKAITLDNQQIDKYTVSTDIDSADRNSAVWSNTNIIAMLTNDENGFIHRWGGEVCYDNYNIKVNQALGRTSGASEVRYGKNIRGMSYEEDTSNVITRLYPVANGGETLNAIEEYKIADTQYVDSANVREYPIPHIAYTNAPFNLVQMSNDGSTNYVVTFAAYELIRDTAANWLNDALLGENTGGVDGLLVDIELAWFVDNYALTLANDGTQGLAEYVTNNICNDGLNPIHSASVKNLIYEAVKAGFELVLKDDTSAAYVGPASKKMWDAPLGDHFYSYTWDSAGDYRVNKNGDADYAWVYANNKWQQLNDDGITTGTVDTAKWKWYKVSGKSFKRYGNKKKKRYLKNQWWNISGVWYLFGSDGKGKSGAELQESCYEDFDVTYVNDKTIYEVLSPICKETESNLFDILYSQMTDYCINMFAEEKISFPTPSISIDMVDLSKTVEYAGYEHLLKIKLGDAVNCINTKLNISTDLRITGLTYDVIKGCNTTIQIGLTETSIIRELDRPNTDSLLEKQGLIAGHGIRIVGNVISATGMNLTDVFVNGQSAVYGGKAYIDLDEILGEGLQWFEETEDALFGYSTELALTDDNAYKISTAGNSITMSSSQTGETLDVAVSGDDSTLLIYYPYAYFSKAQNIIAGINVGNYGNALVLSKSSFSVLTTLHPASGSVNPTVYASFSSSTADGWQPGYTINPDTGQHEYGYNGPITFHGNAQVNGETWYMVMIGYNYQYTMSNTNRSLINYLPVAQYPNGDVTYDAAYETVADLIQATVPLTRSTEGGSFNGISREGNLAFFAGADDEHGTNAPIKIYKDGTYEGLDKVEDVKVDGTSVVTSKIANINTMTGATSGSSGTKGLVPRPLSADREKYLKGDGTWSAPSGASDMQGATAQADGVHGLVPKPLIANREQFLKGDGTWATPTDTQYSDFDGSTHGLVPAPQSGDSGYLKVDGTWDNPSGGSDTVFVNITAISGDATHVTSDKNYNEIKALLDAGKEVILKGANPYRSQSGVDYYYYLDYERSPSYPIIRFRNITEISNRNDEFLATDYWITYDGSNPTTYTVGMTTATKFANKLPSVTSSDNGCVLGVQNAQWQVVSPSGGASYLSALSDVDLTSPTNGQVLKYDSTNSKWVNANESGGGGGGINYSTTEQDTGLTWIDGRPVYQKTYYFGTVAQGVSVLDSGFTETLYDHVWQTDIHWRYNTINIDIGNHGGTGGAIFIESYNNQGLYAVNSTGVDITDLYLTVRYTKTADIQS